LTNHDVVGRLSLLVRNDGFEVQVINLPERGFDLKVNVLDSTKLQMHTGWVPTVDFDSGLRRTYEWLRALEK
jgi:UDP-glucose 4-epimerase